MKLSEINIRDPFILSDGGKYYMYGTRAAGFGINVGGFDVYISEDLETWSEPIACFDAEKYNLNREVCWAPEVHKYGGKYYMFATFTRENGLRGTYALVSDTPDGQFAKHSERALTPDEWECLDGTLYISKSGKPYLVFCHEHTQIIDGAVCYVELSDDLSKAVSEPINLFNGSTPYYIEKKPEGEHYITDGPFMYRSIGGELFMIWSTFINHNYAQCIAKSDNGELYGGFTHLEPLIKDDGGHGMIFRAGEELCLTFHSPNQTGYERPRIIKIHDNGTELSVK